MPRSRAAGGAESCGPPLFRYAGLLSPGHHRRAIQQPGHRRILELPDDIQKEVIKLIKNKLEKLKEEFKNL